MKKRIAYLLFILLALVAGSACAELSTNLQQVTTTDPRTKLTLTRTYVDADGNPVVPSDTGYATIRYSYTGKQVTRQPGVRQ